MTKTASVSAGTVGQTFNYVINIANADRSARWCEPGRCDAQGLTLTAAQLAVESTGSLSFATSATSLTVGTASFAAGATATITVTVLVGAYGLDHQRGGDHDDDGGPGDHEQHLDVDDQPDRITTLICR